jgi:hypothetical protein
MSDEIEHWQALIDRFLTGQMAEALCAVEYAAPDVQAPAPLSAQRLTRVRCRHADGASDALYYVTAFGAVLTMLVQLNVWRFVVVYSLPETTEFDLPILRTRLERWQIGAEHAGWKIGWRQSIEPEHGQRRIVEIYCYANAPRTFLEDAREQLFWRTDIVQMTRALILEARRAGLGLDLDHPPEERGLSQ